VKINVITQILFPLNNCLVHKLVIARLFLNENSEKPSKTIQDFEKIPAHSSAASKAGN
jgi:hypothetical protein